MSKVKLECWYLRHKRENRIICCQSWSQATAEFYMQWRDEDGSIPWTIHYGDPLK